MSSAQSGDVENKFERMHQLALTMYRSGDSGAALKIWRRIQEKSPDFPDIGKWIQRAARPPYPPSTPKQQTDPTVFRTQRELMSNYGHTARRRQFRPKIGVDGMNPRFRHRNIVYLMLVLGVLCIFLSIRNNRSYHVVLNPVTSRLDCYQGLFFPFGNQLTNELEVGIDRDWTDIFQENADLERLRRGITVHSTKSFDQLMIEVYMNLGNEALKQVQNRSQQSAIYYFKRIEAASFREMVKTKIAEAFLNLAELSITSGDMENATLYYQSARGYDHSHPRLFDVQERISRSSSNSVFR